MPQWLRVLTALAEDPVPSPSTHLEFATVCNQVLEDAMSLLSPMHLVVHINSDLHTYTCTYYYYYY